MREKEPQVINPLKDKTDYGWHFEQNVYDADGIIRSLKSSEGSGNIPKVIEKQSDSVLIKQATKRGYIECAVGGVADFSFPDSKTRRGRVQGGGHICPTITSESMEICKIERLRGGTAPQRKILLWINRLLIFTISVCSKTKYVEQ